MCPHRSRPRRSRLAVHRTLVMVAALPLLAASGCGPVADDRPDAGRASGDDYRGRRLPEPVPKADFVLPDTEGRPFDFRAETRGLVTLLFFGYTSCPDICPIHMANLAAVMKDLPADVRTRIQVVFVTTDPQTDTPERIRDWLDSFNADFVGLRGPLDQVNGIQERLGLPPASMVEKTEGGGHMVGHSTAILAFTTDERAHLSYPFGIRQADWAHDLPRLVREEWTEAGP